ncbi:MAG: F0F1 ATP synthase subunit delta [Paracoccaceae bacterium]
MSPTWVTFGFEAANFLLLMALLAWLFFRPVRDAIERRRAQIEGEQRAASESHAKAEQERQALVAARSAFEADQKAVRERARREMEQERQALLEDARAQVAREHGRFEAERRAARVADRHAHARDAALAAKVVVERLLAHLDAGELGPGLVAAACRDLERLRGGGRPLGSVVVESATPLDPASEARLAAAVGHEALSLRVDPTLVGGLRVVTDRGLVDASVSGIAAQAALQLEDALEGGLDAERADHG